MHTHAHNNFLKTCMSTGSLDKSAPTEEVHCISTHHQSVAVAVVVLAVVVVHLRRASSPAATVQVVGGWPVARHPLSLPGCRKLGRLFTRTLTLLADGSVGKRIAPVLRPNISARLMARKSSGNWDTIMEFRRCRRRCICAVATRTWLEWKQLLKHIRWPCSADRQPWKG